MLPSVLESDGPSPLQHNLFSCKPLKSKYSYSILSSSNSCIFCPFLPLPLQKKGGRRTLK